MPRRQQLKAAAELTESLSELDFARLSRESVAEGTQSTATAYKNALSPLKVSSDAEQKTSLPQPVRSILTRSKDALRILQIDVKLMRA